ncbi:MAG: hypothetical protein LWW94_03235 [Candidatus Desulfofervidaceae bacterium]|nr:hypothetical protein [Candidatus Desulfofervidaceae bacterium]
MAVFTLSLGAFLLFLTIGPYWATTSDISKKHAGKISGIMNTGANLGGTIFPYAHTLYCSKTGLASGHIFLCLSGHSRWNFIFVL